MLVKPTTTGPGKVVRFKRRQVRRNPRRPLEAVQQDFERWDALAGATGINWSELTRRALNNMYETFYANSAKFREAERERRLSEKPARKNSAPARPKLTATRAGRKG